jgi:hypothetical protein
MGTVCECCGERDSEEVTEEVFYAAGDEYEYPEDRDMDKPVLYKKVICSDCAKK